MSYMDSILVDGKVIFYNINSEFTHCQYDKNGQLIKAQRMILFFDDLGNSIGSCSYYNYIDQLTNISKQAVLNVYNKEIKNKCQ